MIVAARLLAATMLAAGTAACAHATATGDRLRPAPTGTVATIVLSVDDANGGLGLGRFHYSGRWERVRNRTDGRDGGTSTRSPYVGDSFALAFIGYRFRVYGVVGPKGGHGILGIDRTANVATLDFFAPAKRTHVLLYTSPVLVDGMHVAGVIVAPGRDAASRGSYVNVDSVAVDMHPR